MARTRRGRRRAVIKVLWPDGPRYVSDETIRGWASDALYNEFQVDRPMSEIDVDEAIEIVNDAGYATTAEEGGAL